MPSVLVVSAITCALALDSGGYFPEAWVWSAVVLLWLTAVTLVVRPGLAAARRALLASAAASALTVWALLSTTWSVGGAQSVLEARRDLVYAAGALAAATAFGRLGARAAGAGILAAAALVAAVGIGRYVVSGAVDPAQRLLLSWPVGYANAFAALAAIALPLAVGHAAHARRPIGRSAAAASAPLFVAVPLLASSRGGVVAALVAVAALFALDRRRRVLVHVGLRLAPALVVAGGACSVPDLGARRVAVAAGLLVALPAAALAARREFRVPRGPAFSHRAATAVVALAVAAATAVTAFPSRHLVGPERNAYWHVARHVVTAHPLGGIGAGGFGRAWLDEAPSSAAGALDVHNLYLEALAELGPIGLVLVLVLVGLPLTRARAAADGSRLGATTVAAYVAFVAHALLDWDWEMPAVTLAAVVLGTSVLVIGERRQRTVPDRLRLLLAGAAVAAALAALAGLRSSTVPAAAAKATAAHPERR